MGPWARARRGPSPLCLHFAPPPPLPAVLLGSRVGHGGFSHSPQERRASGAGQAPTPQLHCPAGAPGGQSGASPHILTLLPGRSAEQVGAWGRPFSFALLLRECLLGLFSCTQSLAVLCSMLTAPPPPSSMSRQAEKLLCPSGVVALPQTAASWELWLPGFQPTDPRSARKVVQI